MSTQVRGRIKRSAAWADKVSNAVNAYNVAIKAAAEVLGEFPLALTWKHYIDIESKARKLSKLVFEGKPDLMKGDQSEEQGASEVGTVYPVIGVG